MRAICILAILPALLLCGAGASLAAESGKDPAAGEKAVKASSSAKVPLFADAKAAKPEEAKAAKETKGAKEEPKVPPKGIRLEVPPCLSFQWCGCCLLAPLSFLGF